MFSRLAVHQDFLWFFALLGWSFALVLWRRHPRRTTDWPWLPWAAAAGVATALVQFGMFSPTFDAFQARLIPGTVSNYRPARVDPYWLGDVLIGFAEAAMAAGWIWLGLARRSRVVRAALIVLVLGLAVGRALLPDPPAWGLAVAVALAGGLRWRRLAAQRISRAGLCGAILLPWLSTIGPAAAYLGMVQRDGPPQPVGLLASTFQLLVSGLVLWGLVRGSLAVLTPEARAQLRRDARPYVPVAVAVLVGGVALGVQTGRDNRHEIQQNRLRQTAGHAHVFPGELLAPLASPSFRFEPVGGLAADGGPRTEFSDYLAGGALRDAERRLAEVALSSPFLHAARILVLHDGWIVAVASTRPNGPSGTIELVRRATADDLARWEAAEPHVEESPVPEIGQFYYTRGPILTRDGRMVGWLDGVRQEYFLSMERRWRAAPFVVTGLALIILAQMFSHQWSARLREAAVRAAAVAAESSRVKTAFLAKVSHELRTPLQSILGYSELLQAELRGDAERARVAAIRQHGKLMLRLVNDLLDLSAVEAGAFRLVEKPVQFVALVRQTVEGLRPRAEAKGLALDFRADGAIPPWLMADGERVRQLLLNLAGNALKFTERGSVSIALEAAPRTGPSEYFNVRLVVADTGPGIPRADQQRIFEPFQRLDPAAPLEGAGLGLALVSALCRSMRGDIAVESDGRTGSIFRARLGFRVVPKTVMDGAVAVARLAGRRVLVADDSPLVRELFRSHLAGLGAHCRLAPDGEQAISLAPDCDAVVLDLAMPRIDGPEVARRLRASGSRALIIGVSAHAGAAERERALAAGMDVFLTKPVELASLAAALEPLAQGSPAVPAAGEAALRKQLEDQFRAEASAQAAAVAQSLARADWPEVAAKAHYLKSSAAVVRDDRLFAACGRMQEAAESGDADAAGAAWSECRLALQRWVGAG